MGRSKEGKDDDLHHVVVLGKEMPCGVCWSVVSFRTVFDLNGNPGCLVAEKHTGSTCDGA